MGKKSPPIPWLQRGDSFPPVHEAWASNDPAPGLLAAGGALDVNTLVSAYSHGIFPWYSAGQPVLWWSPDPRMVLRPEQFKLRRSLLKTIRRFSEDADCEIRFDCAFDAVIENCASQIRLGQSGTWIVPDMVQAYIALHRAGHAHSVETWIDGTLVGGLYCVNIGGMVFGESMFAHRTDASKIALAALVAFCAVQGIRMIDCQQNTRHLASLGAAEIPRTSFLAHVNLQAGQATPKWNFSSLYWHELLAKRTLAIR